MGFYVTDTECARPAKADPRSKNRVMGSRRSPATRARFPAPEPVDLHQETRDTSTQTVSGLACWLSRDPINEHGAILVQNRKPRVEPKDSPPFGEEALDEDEASVEFNPLNEANVYLFVWNSPIDLVDPLGLAPFCVCIRCGSDHCWIHVKDKATGVIHSYGRWKIGYGTPPTPSSGVNVDRELTRPFEASRCLQVDSFTPTINAGYGVTHNNCATYARDEWSRVFGEGLYAGTIYHDPATLRNSIKSKNGGAPKAYHCCFPWSP